MITNLIKLPWCQPQGLLLWKGWSKLSFHGGKWHCFHATTPSGKQRGALKMEWTHFTKEGSDLGLLFNWTGKYHIYFSQWWWQARGSNSLCSVYKGKQLPGAWSLTRSHLYCAHSLGRPSSWQFDSENSNCWTTWHGFWSSAPGRHTLNRTSDLSSFIVVHQSWKSPFCWQPKLSKLLFALAETATSLHMCVCLGTWTHGTCRDVL